MTSAITPMHQDPIIDVLLREIAATGHDPAHQQLAVIDDQSGLLTEVMRNTRPASLRATSDIGFDMQVTEAVDLPNLVTADTTLTVGYLPKSLAELDEIAATVASGAPNATLMLAAREKHLVRSMNDVLARHFAAVRGSRGARKSRVLVATKARAEAESKYPLYRVDSELDLAVCAHGAVFAGNELDIGTRALLDALRALPGGRLPSERRNQAVARAVDLGCGSGILATVLARSYPEAEVIATDRSWAACASAAATALANGCTNVRVERADAGATIARNTVDLVLCNPPFHEGRDVDNGMANAMFRSAGRMLRSGGECITVFNSHLRHRVFLERFIGPTEELARTAKFTVTRSVVS